MKDRRIGQQALLLGIMFLAQGLAIAPAYAEEWSLPDTRIGTRTAPLLLLSRADVQADLKLEATQVTGLRSVIAELTKRGLALRGKSGPAVISERRAIDQAQLDWLSENLSRNQLERLEQLEIQWEGPAAILSRPRVAEYLKLTDEQRQSLARLVSERHAATSRGTATGPTDRSTFNVQAQGVLTESQREQWYRLLGTPLAFHQPAAPATRDDATQRAGHSTQTR